MEFEYQAASEAVSRMLSITGQLLYPLRRPVVSSATFTCWELASCATEVDLIFKIL